MKNAIIILRLLSKFKARMFIFWWVMAAQTDRQTDRHTERQTYRQRDRHA